MFKATTVLRALLFVAGWLLGPVVTAMGLDPEKFWSIILGADWKHLIPEFLTYQNVRLGIVALGVLIIIGMVALPVGAPFLERHRQKKRRIPIAVSRIETRSGGYALFSEHRPHDAWRMQFGDSSCMVTITNTSKTDKVSLDIWLHMKGENFKYKLLANLDGPFMNKLGKDDPFAKSSLKHGWEPEQYFKSPLNLEPQETVRKRLSFLHNYCDFDDPITSNIIGKNLDFEIEFFDHISGSSARFSIPGEYRA